MKGGKMTEAEIRAKVDKVLTEGFEIEPANIRPEALLREDLGLDSLDAVDLIVALEKQFGLRIEESEARAIGCSRMSTTTFSGNSSRPGGRVCVRSNCVLSATGALPVEGRGRTEL